MKPAVPDDFPGRPMLARDGSHCGHSALLQLWLQSSEPVSVTLLQWDTIIAEGLISGQG